jgi:hypothetical protein
MRILEPLITSLAADGGDLRRRCIGKTSPIKSKCACCEKLLTAAFFSHFVRLMPLMAALQSAISFLKCGLNGDFSRMRWRTRTQAVCRPRTHSRAILAWKSGRS